MTDQADYPQRIDPLAVFPDAQHVVMQTRFGNGTGDLLRMSLEGDRVVEELLDSSGNELNAALSADGRWIAYQSDESGRNEIYVRPFPDVEAGRWQVSRTGGSQPVWSPDPDRQELFYWDPTPSLVAVPVRGEGATFAHGNPEALFDAAEYLGGVAYRQYDVSPDGNRFLMIKMNGVEDVGTMPEIIIVEHWFERAAPGGAGLEELKMHVVGAVVPPTNGIFDGVSQKPLPRRLSQDRQNSYGVPKTCDFRPAENAQESVTFAPRNRRPATTGF